MDSFGQRLKSEREARGVSLADIATATKISPAALEALERNDVQRLPGGIFGRAIVRSYAISVGLDPEATVNEFISEIARVERERARTKRAPEITSDDRLFLERQRRAVRTLRAVLTGLVVVGAVTVSWYLWGRHWMSGQPASATPSSKSSAPPAAAGLPPPATDPVPVTPTPPPVGAASTPAVPPAQHAAEVVAPLVVEFEVTAECWVRITADGSRTPAVNGIMQPGSRRRVPAVNSIQLNLGNAGAFQWWINGKPAKLLGALGATRLVTVTGQNFGTFLQ